MQLQQALYIATGIQQNIAVHCTTTHIAGSIRRNCTDVGDIELLCAPKLIPVDLFASQFARSGAFTAAVQGFGHIAEGNPATGRYCKIMLPQGIQLDLFIPQPHDYYRQLAIRTGSRDFAYKVIAAAWHRKGWCGTADGLRRQTDCIQNPDGKTWKCVSANPTLPPVWQSEEELFSWLGIQYFQPCEREYITNENFLKQ